MTLRLIYTADESEFTAKVYRNVEWSEYVVKHSTYGIKDINANYHTDDKQDAINHARGWTLGMFTASRGTCQ